MRSTRCIISKCAGSIITLLFFITSTWLHGQHPSTQPEDARKENPLKINKTIKVAVDEMRLDAVVLDSNLKPITDLTADDFEIYQDYAPQEVLSSVYVTHQAEQSAASWMPGQKRTAKAPSVAPAPERKDINRIMVFIVDDFSMNFTQLHYARMALNRFVERQMQSGDMAAILRTIRGSSAFNVFSSHKPELSAKIDILREWGASPNDAEILDRQLAIMRYSIRALKDMPGRKAIVLLSPKPTLHHKVFSTVEEMFSGKYADYNNMYRSFFNKIADEALRAKVVVHMMDIHGLEAPNMEAIDAEQFGKMEPDKWSRQAFNDLDERKLDELNPVMVKTGGALIQNTNFFLDGVGEQIHSIMDGYYLLSYAPPAGTFRQDKNPLYHKIKIRVKRRGATVYARDGFLGRIDEDASPKYANSMQEAIFSPFKNKDLTVDLTSGFIDNASRGYLLRSWLQLDAKNITINEKAGDGYRVQLETICLTSDINGYIKDARMLQYEFKIRPENLSWIRDHGIRFSLVLPVKNPGAYYVHAAVRDKDSGKIGSAYQFIQIPNLKKIKPALSNIFVVNRAEDAEWIKNGAMNEPAQTSFEPVLKRNAERTQAVRQYAPGEHLRYMAVLYNAKHEKAAAPDLAVQSVLYKDGAEIYKSGFKPLNLDGATNYDRIPLDQNIALDAAMPKGNYVLELMVRDNKRKEKKGIASQAMDFQITASNP